MHPDTLIAEIERDPFVPLRLRLFNGDTLDIPDPGSCYIAGLSLYVFRVKRGHMKLADHVRLVSLRHIVSVEMVQNAA